MSGSGGRWRGSMPGETFHLAASNGSIRRQSADTRGPLALGRVPTWRKGQARRGSRRCPGRGGRVPGVPGQPAGPTRHRAPGHVSTLRAEMDSGERGVGQPAGAVLDGSLD